MLYIEESIGWGGYTVPICGYEGYAPYHDDLFENVL